MKASGKNKRIGVLGSVCDPPHQAHIQIGDYAKKFLKLDTVFLVPVNTPPHKSPPVAPARMRLAMARLAIKGKKRWHVSDIEMKRGGTTYTRDTIRAFKKKYPGAELFWIVGADAIVSMPWKWKGGDVLELCRFVAFPRPGYSLKNMPAEIQKKIIVLNGIRPYDVSSMKIRLLLKNKKSVMRFVAPAVARYIKKMGLYENE